MDSTSSIVTKLTLFVLVGSAILTSVELVRLVKSRKTLKDEVADQVVETLTQKFPLVFNLS